MNEQITKVFEQLFVWGKTHGLIILSIILLTWIISKFMNRILEKTVRKIIPRSSFNSQEDEWMRENTLIKIANNFFRIFIWIIAAIAIMHQLGVPTAPLITGAGILGVAIGFGAQSLVKDVITGLFIISENQFRIGDFIKTSGYMGTVEDMTLRVTHLRSLDGSIHYIPNSEIKIVSNTSKDFSMVNFLIGVGYKTNLDLLEEVINRAGEHLAEDEMFGEYIIEAPKFLRVDEFQDYAIAIRIIGKVKPTKQHLITGEMRRRLKQIFEEHDIEIPYPTSVIYRHNAD